MDPEDSVECIVVVNDEEQHSIWPAYRTVPAGWRATGVTGPRQRCLDHIEEAWPDIRPLSTRLRLTAQRTDAGTAGGEAR
jgi:MbtH protein